MKKKWIYIVCLFGFLKISAQECPIPVLLTPENGDIGVPVDVTISWTEVVGVPAYLISLGTTPGGSELLNRLNVGSATSYKPPLGLPDMTQIYVTITLFSFETGVPEVVCNSEAFRTQDFMTAPACTGLTSPLQGATSVNSATNISWAYAVGATGYRLSIGTSSGGTDILSDADLGNVLTYNPPTDLPSDTEIFVQITPYNENGEAISCNEQSFTTGAVAALPGCTSLLSPLNGAVDVPLTPLIEWVPVAGATGYRVTIGSSPFTGEIVDNLVFTTNATFVINFEPNKTFFIQIVPFNDAGDAIGCQQEFFSTVQGCGPYFDPDTGELVVLNPEIDFPEVVSFCENDAPFTISSMDVADGYRWYQIDAFGDEALISESQEVALTEIGEYRYEAYNVVAVENGVIECQSSQLFSVVSSEIASIDRVNLVQDMGELQITVMVSGIGDYEYALNINGPYQEDPQFNGLPLDSYTVYVRDKNGCGIAERRIEQDLTLEGFPKFFTPNGDGINDFWQFIPPLATGEIPVEVIHIFDRFGVLIAQIDPTSQGWDGTFNGNALPASDYWFRATSSDNQKISGHFALKR